MVLQPCREPLLHSGVTPFIEVVSEKYPSELVFFSETNRTASKKVFGSQMGNVFDSHPAFGNGSIVSVRPFVIAFATREREGYIRRDSIGRFDYALRTLPHELACRGYDNSIQILTKLLPKLNLRSKAIFAKPVEQRFRQFKNVVPVTVEPRIEQHSPRFLWVHNYTANTRLSSRPIFVSSAVRSPASLTRCDSFVSASTSAKMVKPPFF